MFAVEKLGGKYVTSYSGVFVFVCVFSHIVRF